MKPMPKICQVKDPQRVSEWYKQHLHLELLGSRQEFGAQVLGTKENGAALVLLPGEEIDKPESLQIHFYVKDVDAEYKRLQANEVEFSHPPKDMPWGWRLFLVILS